MARDPSPPIRMPGLDLWLLGATLLLSAFGLVMVYSASAVYAIDRFGSDTHFLLRQLAYLVTGLGVLWGAQWIDYRTYRKLARPLLLAAFALLVAVLLPGLGVRVGGAQRWFRFGPLSLQPSELAKVALVFYLAALLHDKAERLTHFWNGFMAPLAVVMLVTGLTLLQPDLGTSVLLGLTAVLMLFVAGTRLTYIAVAAMAAAPMAWYAIVGTPWRLQRLLAFFAPEAFRRGAGYQVWEALVTLGSGGMTGVGLGQGQQKMFYLPEAHTDFILAVVGQELGFVGIALVLILFGVILWRGTRIALTATDRFGTYLAFGFTGLLAIQASINMAVVLGVVPTKGITLPFVSYGGSSLIASFFMVGVLLSVAQGHRVPAGARLGRTAWGLRRAGKRDPVATAPLGVTVGTPVRVSTRGLWRAFQRTPRLGGSSRRRLQQLANQGRGR